ncbi:penicillin-binding protein activator [Acidocella aromatica]|uniref:ABC-type branched-subunit amino acid transport system substrate-binding protein n=1 Tax=Acidocella aromatica TaxID=1303579 RepID=A0A840VLV5_9PROT|nr:ABC-type branched-subunit amino acid transport system substrate-binding protein [Acidocella aromatica]
MPQAPLNAGPPAQLAPSAASSAPNAYGRTSGNVLLLAPLTGNLAPVGQALVNAAKLAFPANGAPALDVRDTGGTPQGAVAAAQAGLAAGDGIIIGPLTSAETQAVAPIAHSAGVNVLAFTNDGTAASPGVWPLGITPAQQVQRVLRVAADSGRTQLAALLPDNDFGHHLSDAISAQASELGEPAAQITFYQPGFSNVNQAVEQLSDFSNRGQGLMNQIKHAQDLGTAAGRAQADKLRHQQIPPPSFNALFIGATDANTLAEMANFLPYYDVTPPQVQFLGPALWANIAPQMANQSVLVGALYAAPDPAASAAFDAKYQSAYGAAPPAIADVAFDAAAMAKLAAGEGGYTSSVLTAPSGFTGTNGVLVLHPDGTVKRGLAVFSVQPGQPTITSPAPSSLNQP